MNASVLDGLRASWDIAFANTTGTRRAGYASPVSGITSLLNRNLASTTFAEKIVRSVVSVHPFVSTLAFEPTDPFR